MPNRFCALNVGFAGKPKHSSEPRFERVHACEYCNPLHWPISTDYYGAHRLPDQNRTRPPRLSAFFNNINPSHNDSNNKYGIYRVPRNTQKLWVSAFDLRGPANYGPTAT
jgi:hypothetical protein